MNDGAVVMTAPLVFCLYKSAPHVLDVRRGLCFELFTYRQHGTVGQFYFAGKLVHAADQRLYLILGKARLSGLYAQRVGHVKVQRHC